MAPPAPGELPPLFVISLERSLDRREKLKARAEPLGIPLTFVPAVDGRTLPEALRARSSPEGSRRHYGRVLKPGELGCHFSHEQVWRRIVEEGLTWAVVLEDDPVLDEGLLPAIRAVGALQRPWDLIRLAGFQRRRGTVVERLSDGRELIRTSRNFSGANAYALHNSGARKLLAYTRTVVHPVDDAIDRIWENGLDLYAVRPFPVREDSSQDSTIRAERSRTPLDPAPPAQRLAVRYRRLKDSVHRRWHNLTKLRVL